MKTIRRQKTAEEGPTSKIHRQCSRLVDGDKIAAARCLDHGPKKILQSGPLWANLQFCDLNGAGRVAETETCDPAILNSEQATQT
jgi:hypothetical protein